MGQSGQYDFYYQGDKVGIDSIGEVLDSAEMMGKIQKGGAWYTIGEERFQGRSKALDYLKENPDVVESLKSEIYG
jgi:recombination protein RecA